MKKRWIFLLLLIIGIISFFIDSYVLEFFKLIEDSNLTLSFIIITFFGEWWAVGILVFLIFLRKRGAMLNSYISLIVALFLVYILKFLINRERPLDSLVFENLGSFPSGHATLVFSIWPILAREFKKWKWWIFAFILLIAISRLYLRVHFLSDVLFGVLIGYSIGEGVLYVKEKYRI